MLKLFVFETVVKLNHGLKRFHKEGWEVLSVEPVTVRSVVYPEHKVVADKIQYQVLVKTDNDDSEDEIEEEDKKETNSESKPT